MNFYVVYHTKSSNDVCHSKQQLATWENRVGCWVEGGAQANGTDHGYHVCEYHMVGAGDCCLASTGPVPGMVLGALPASSHWIPAAQWGKCCLCPNFPDGKLSLKGHGELDKDHLAGQRQSKGL